MIVSTRWHHALAIHLWGEQGPHRRWCTLSVIGWQGTTTYAVGESPTQLWMEIEVIFRRWDGEESKCVAKFIIILFHILSACNLLSKSQRQQFYWTWMVTWYSQLLQYSCAHIVNSTKCSTAAAHQQIKCRAYLIIVRRGIATAIKINKGIREFASSKNMRHRWKNTIHTSIFWQSTRSCSRDSRIIVWRDSGFGDNPRTGTRSPPVLRAVTYCIITVCRFVHITGKMTTK